MDALKEHILSNIKKYQWKNIFELRELSLAINGDRLHTGQVVQVIRQERSIARPDAMAVMQITNM